MTAIANTTALFPASRLINLEQGTYEWLEWRMGGLGASDAPVVMGVSPYSTSRTLWERFLGIRPAQSDNPGMSRGRRLEPVARDLFMQEMGIDDIMVFCLEHLELPFLRASLDGFSFSLDAAQEIKCPCQEDHDIAKAGNVPAKYHWQVVQQSFLMGGKDVYYISYRPEDEEQPLAWVFLSGEELATDFGALVRAMSDFWANVQNGEWPTDSDDGWQEAVAQWRIARRVLAEGTTDKKSADMTMKEAKAAEEVGKAKIIALTRGVKKFDAGDLLVSWSEKPRDTDWQALAVEMTCGIADLCIERKRFADDKSLERFLLTLWYAHAVRRTDHAAIVAEMQGIYAASSADLNTVFSGIVEKHTKVAGYDFKCMVLDNLAEALEVEENVLSKMIDAHTTFEKLYRFTDRLEKGKVA